MSANSKTPRRFFTSPQPGQPGQPAPDEGTSARRLSSPEVQERLHKRITRAITPALLLFVAGIILLTTVVVNVRMTRTVYDSRQQAAVLVQSVLKLELEDLFVSLRNISQLSGVRAFAVTAVTLPQGTESRAIRTSQSEMLRAFEDLLNNYEGQLTSVRYLLPSGGVWGSAQQSNDLIQLDAALNREDAVIPSEDAIFAQALSAPAGTILASQVINNPNALTLYTPVASLDGTNAGVIEITPNVPAIFRRLETGLITLRTDSAAFSWRIAATASCGSPAKNCLMKMS